MLSRECNAVGAEIPEQAGMVRGPLSRACPQADPVADIESLIHEAGRQVGFALAAGLALAGLASLFF